MTQNGRPPKDTGADTTQPYEIRRVYHGERTAREVAAALIKAHSR